MYLFINKFSASVVELTTSPSVLSNCLFALVSLGIVRFPFVWFSVVISKTKSSLPLNSCAFFLPLGQLCTSWIKTAKSPTANWPERGQEVEFRSCEHSLIAVLNLAQSTRFWLQTVTAGKRSWKTGTILLPHAMDWITYELFVRDYDSCLNRIGEEIHHDKWDAVQGAG